MSNLSKAAQQPAPALQSSPSCRFRRQEETHAARQGLFRDTARPCNVAPGCHRGNSVDAPCTLPLPCVGAPTALFVLPCEWNNPAKRTGKSPERLPAQHARLNILTPRRVSPQETCKYFGRTPFPGPRWLACRCWRIVAAEKGRALDIAGLVRGI